MLLATFDEVAGDAADCIDETDGGRLDVKLMELVPAGRP